jgi:RimJ/RimL family protein N-acetyltransferase
MPSADVQLAYVKTNKEYRGQGLGGRMLKFTLAHLQAKGKGTGIWYVTDTDNPASMALAEKSGFKFFSYGKKGHLLELNFLPTLEQE